MKLLGRLLLLLCVGAVLFVFGACEKEGPAERAGKELDEAIEQTREKMEEASEEAKEKYEETQESEEEKGHE